MEAEFMPSVLISAPPIISNPRAVAVQVAGISALTVKILDVPLGITQTSPEKVEALLDISF